MKSSYGGIRVRHIVVALVLLCVGEAALAQTSRIVSIIDTLKKQNTSLGRELWFTMCKNADRQVGQYYTLYVTSPKNTVINIHGYGSFAFNQTQSIAAGEILTFNIPLQFELQTSSLVEDKGIRVWSEDADLSAYLLSHNTQSSDGMLIIPTTGWGTEYVVASYESLQLGYSPGVYDYPSEFAIVANQDNTDCTITPHDNIRSSTDPNVIMHPAGKPFHEMLMSGQTVQYQTIPATATEDFDLTGTTITSTKPIGVVGASQCSNIPSAYVYCDHICDMLPPTRTWAVTYQTVPFAARKCGDSFLMIGTKANGQDIVRNGTHKYSVTGNHGYTIDPGVAEPSTWTSDAPFLLVQYINSSSWETECDPSNTNPKGDPSMVVINSVEQYANDIVFQTPSINTYVNYVNVMVANTAIKNTTYDGIPITSYPSSSQQVVPFSNYTAFQISNVLAGKHEVKSDSGIGVYIYGYGTGESYAWSGALGLRTYNDPDTIAPLTKISGDCFTGFVAVTDNQITPPASQISEMKLDSLFNMRYTPDPGYEIGIASDSTHYLMNVIDSTKEAYLQIEIHDYAGNRTRVTSTYAPQTASIAPLVLNFGSGSPGITACKNITITNTGKVPYSWQTLRLIFGNKGYSITSPDTSPIGVGKNRTIQICFAPPSGGLSTDTLLLSDGCISYQAIVTGTGGQADFAVNGEDFGCHLVGSQTIHSGTTISNVSDATIRIDSIWITPPTNFALNPQLTFPIFINANGQLPVGIAFTPNTTGSFNATINILSNQIGETKTAALSGCGIAPSSRISANLDTVSVCGQAISFADTIVSTGSTETTINSIIVSDTNFHITSLLTGSGLPVGKPPVSLQKNESVIVYLSFYPPPKASGIFQTQIYGVSDLGDTTNIVTARVQAIYRELAAKTGSVIIPNVPYGSPAITGKTSYCNDMTDTVTITGANLIPSTYSKAYTVSDFQVNGVSRKPPFGLAAGECLNIIFSFNPSYSTDSTQPAQFILQANTCIAVPVGSVTAGTIIGGPQALGFTITTPILSCDTKTDSVFVINPSPYSSVIMTITNVSLKHSTSNFIVQFPASADVAGGKSMPVQVVFAPAATSSLVTYQDTVIITLTDAGGNTYTIEAPISAAASGMSASITPALSVNSASAGSTVISLPIDITIAKNGITDNISELGIKKIELVYSYQTDLLQPVGESLSTAFISKNGWQLDNTSKITDPNGPMLLVLTNSSSLADGMTSLGEIHYYPTVARAGTKGTPLSLISIGLFTTDSALAGNCIATSSGKETDFTLHYQCGDSSLANFLETGKTPIEAMAANPNPVSKSAGGIVTLDYAVREEGVLSVVLYDGLGREVSRIMDGIYHRVGTYQLQADLRSQPSGIYFYRFLLHSAAVSGKIAIEN